MSFGGGGEERRISAARCLVSVETGDVGNNNNKRKLIISGLLRMRIGCLSDMLTVSVSKERQLGQHRKKHTKNIIQISATTRCGLKKKN